MCVIFRNVTPTLNTELLCMTGASIISLASILTWFKKFSSETEHIFLSFQYILLRNYVEKFQKIFLYYPIAHVQHLWLFIIIYL
jgi:hypothetical protein